MNAWWLGGRMVKAAALKALDHWITSSNPTWGSKIQKPFGLPSCVLGLGHLNTTAPDLVEGQYGTTSDLKKSPD